MLKLQTCIFPLFPICTFLCICVGLNKYIEPEATNCNLEIDLRLRQHTQGFLQGNQDIFPIRYLIVLYVCLSV